MEKRGEITVFFSLILVCVLSLLMGLFESARTTGARLYLRMAADSAAASVMSQYNKNLWEMYRLLFLEYESEQAIVYSFNEYFDFYLSQENFYAAKRESVELSTISVMQDHGARPLEEEILAYVKYRLPDIAGNLSGIADAAKEAGKAGDFRALIEVCRQAGKRTRGLEKRRREIEASLEEMERLWQQAKEAAEKEQEGAFRRAAGKLRKEMQKFPARLTAYENELAKLSAHRDKLADSRKWEEDAAYGEPDDMQASEGMENELTAYRDVEQAAEQYRKEYRAMEQEIEGCLDRLEEAFLLLEEGDGDEEENEPDWNVIESCIDAAKPPDPHRQETDEEKSAALERLEKLLERDILSLVLPENTVVSEKKISRKGVPSSHFSAGKSTEKNPAEQLLINEYLFLYFDSYIAKHTGRSMPDVRDLSYELEYLLCGETSDRENLKETAEKLLAVRGAMNFLYLLNASEKKAQADGLAASISGGNIAAQFVISFFVLALWAFGEAVLDLRCLFAGGTVPFWKNEGSWRTDLEALLSLRFLDMEGTGNRDETKGGYEDYMRILFFLQNREVRNYRMMDVIQWNIRKKQPDFSIESCLYKMEMEARVRQRHRFLLHGEYGVTVNAKGSYTR